jgi:hypothetical protein
MFNDYKVRVVSEIFVNSKVTREECYSNNHKSPKSLRLADIEENSTTYGSLKWFLVETKVKSYFRIS